LGRPELKGKKNMHFKRESLKDIWNRFSRDQQKEEMKKQKGKGDKRRRGVRSKKSSP